MVAPTIQPYWNGMSYNPLKIQPCLILHQTIDYDFKYHYWNPINEKLEAVNLSKLFRSDYSMSSDTKLPDPPSPEVYTVITLGTAFVLFGAFYLFYGLLLALIKYFINGDFGLSTHGTRIRAFLNYPRFSIQQKKGLLKFFAPILGFYTKKSC